MQIVRTILWVLLLVGILAFSFGNWDKEIDVRIWPGIVWDTRIPALVIVAFLVGLVPTWLYHRSVRWRLQRRNTALETAAARLNTQREEEAAAAAAASRPPRPEAVHAPLTDGPPQRPGEPVSPITPEATTPRP